jgi:integrase
LRLSEALRLEWRDVLLADSVAYCGRTKNGEPRTLFLPPVVVAALANLPAATGACSGSTRTATSTRLLRRTKAQAPGLSWVGFHTFRHTWATWMRKGARRTDEKSASRYAQLDEEARRGSSRRQWRCPW